MIAYLAVAELASGPGTTELVEVQLFGVGPESAARFAPGRLAAMGNELLFVTHEPTYSYVWTLMRSDSDIYDYEMADGTCYLVDRLLFNSAARAAKYITDAISDPINDYLGNVIVVYPMKGIPS